MAVCYIMMENADISPQAIGYRVGKPIEMNILIGF